MTTSAEPSAVDTRARLPGFFIVGQSKSGTTALYEMLKRHPQLFLPDFKEPSYFAADLRPRVKQRVPEPETLEEYLPLFAPALPTQIPGEASSLYLYSHEAAGAIARVAPDARIIAILREPASFLHSLHLQLVQNRLEDHKDLAQALALEGERREGRAIPASCYRPQALFYSERVRYLEQLRRYHAVFPPEQVLVLIYDDFRSRQLRHGADGAAVPRGRRGRRAAGGGGQSQRGGPFAAPRRLRHRLGGGANAPGAGRGRRRWAGGRAGCWAARRDGRCMRARRNPTSG